MEHINSLNYILETSFENILYKFSLKLDLENIILIICRESTIFSLTNRDYKERHKEYNVSLYERTFEYKICQC